MKKLFFLSLMTLTVSVYAQSDKYHSAMMTNIAMLDSAKTPEDFTAAAAAFERIGDAEKNQWLPYYYAAIANIFRGFQDQGADKDKLADKADAMLDKAEALQPKNADIYVAKAMSAVVHMIVDPMSRWMQYGQKQKEAMENAKQYDENNPRIYLFEGQSTMNTPEQFGGGKDKAKPILQKAVQKFGSFKPASDIDPHWGAKQAQQALEQCG